VLHSEWKEIETCDTDLASCEAACTDEGDGDTCFNAALELQSRTQRGAEDPPQVAEYFRRACTLGLALACTNWAAGELPPKDSPAQRCLYRVFDKACDAGEPFGCGMTARLLLDFPRTPVDRWIAYSQLTNACNRFDGPPCRFLAYYYELGDLGAYEPGMIKQLLARACSGGDEDACGEPATASEVMH
jgi:TPR repeat protein